MKKLLFFSIIILSTDNIYPTTRYKRENLSALKMSNTSAHDTVYQVKELLTYSILATGLTITTLSLLHRTINPEKDQKHTLAVAISGIILTTTSVISILKNKKTIHIKDKI